MILQFTRVLLGLAIALFHVQLADFFREQDRALAAAFRDRGILIPGALPKRAAHDLFFFLGIVLALYPLCRIWLTIR